MFNSIYYVARYRLYNDKNELVYGGADEELGADENAAIIEYQKRADARDKTWKPDSSYHACYYMARVEHLDNGKIQDTNIWVESYE